MTTMKTAPGNEEIELMLPWYAAGTLSRRDAARVESALAKDAELARRFELVREELGEAIRSNESLGAPSARAMKQLFEKIEAEPARSAPSPVSFMTRVSEFVASLSPRTLAYAGGVAALAIVLQAGVIGSLIGERSGTAPKLASADKVAPLSQGAEFLVQFAPDANAADIAAFLEANKATIVGGPAAGNFRIRMAPATKEQTTEIVKKLQSSKTISFAAPAN